MATNLILDEDWNRAKKAFIDTGSAFACLLKYQVDKAINPSSYPKHWPKAVAYDCHPDEMPLEDQIEQEQFSQFYELACMLDDAGLLEHSSKDWDGSRMIDPAEAGLKAATLLRTKAKYYASLGRNGAQPLELIGDVIEDIKAQRSSTLENAASEL